MTFNLKKLTEMFERGVPRAVLYEYLLRGKAELRKIFEKTQGLPNSYDEGRADLVKEILGE